MKFRLTQSLIELKRLFQIGTDRNLSHREEVKNCQVITLIKAFTKKRFGYE